MRKYKRISFRKLNISQRLGTIQLLSNFNIYILNSHSIGVEGFGLLGCYIVERC
jgi:hypothetical protein